MKPHSLGRSLGIGLRVAGRIAGQQASRAVQPPPVSAGAPVPPAASERIHQAGQAVSRAARGTGRGLGAFLRPFQRVGRSIWLEVTGVFFLLFVLVFGSTVWHTRSSLLQGPDHQRFLVSAALTAVFLYLSVSSFWRARRR